MTIHNTSREALFDIADAFAHFLRQIPLRRGRGRLIKEAHDQEPYRMSLNWLSG